MKPEIPQAWGPASVGRPLLTRILEGAHPWGTVRVGSSDRWGWQQFRLTVYPPGTNSVERRRLTFLRNWPVFGALVCLVLMAVIGSASLFPPVLVGLVMGLLWALGIAAGFVMTRRIRGKVRRASAVTVRINGRVEIMGDYRLIGRAVDDFAGIDAALAAGALEPVEYESRWATIYDQLAVVSPLGAKR